MYFVPGCRSVPRQAWKTLTLAYHARIKGFEWPQTDFPNALSKQISLIEEWYLAWAENDGILDNVSLFFAAPNIILICQQANVDADAGVGRQVLN